MEKLRKRRGYEKGLITKIETWLRENIDIVNDKNQFDIRQQNLVRAYENYILLQREIAEEDETATHDTEDVDNKFCTVFSALKTKIEQLTMAPSTPNADFSSTYQDLVLNLQQSNKEFVNDLVKGLTSNLNVNKITSQTVKLPEIKIPIFSGDAAEWNSFYDLFTKLILNNSDLDDIQKLIYLKGYLKGEALSLIQNLSLVGANLQTALKLLEDRYKDTYTIIETHISNLLENLPSLIKPKAQNLREFLTKINQNIESLKNLNVPIDQWDLILIHEFSKKLDFHLQKSYCLQRDTKNLPTLNDFLGFLEKQCRVLEELDTKCTSPKPTRRVSHFTSSTTQGTESKSSVKCVYCSGNHSVYKCTIFKNLNVKSRNDFISSQGLCKNCLIQKHALFSCAGKGCIQCGRKHNTLLHINFDNSNRDGSMNRGFQNSGSGQPKSQGSRIFFRNNNNQTNFSNNNGQSRGGSTPQSLRPAPEQSNTRPTDSIQSNSSLNNQEDSASNVNFNQTNSLSFSNVSNENIHVLLATAVVEINDSNGDPVQARCLLDCASQSSICTNELLEKLNLKPYKKLLHISGISQTSMHANKMVDLNILSLEDKTKGINVSCAVLEKITCHLPQINLNLSKLKFPEHVFLADPKFYISSKIDILLGADVYYDLITPGMVKLGDNLPTLCNTILGYVVGGKVSNNKQIKSYVSVNEEIAYQNSPSVSLLTNTVCNMDELIKQFWTIEEVENKNILSPDDEKAEENFQKTTCRLVNGRFQINLPFKNNDAHLKLGDSFSQAKRRFICLEKRFLKNLDLKEKYKEFIDEYIELKHAKVVPLNLQNEKGENKYFLPHHAVIREHSETTKLRVVFDASMKTSSGLSLNDVLLKGYTVQPELFDIICRFRLDNFVAIADIEKMYRQIQVNPEHTFLQNILWRANPDEPLQCIELSTVTYGTNFAPFIATRCLKELADKSKDTFPLAADILLNQTYVDDALIGAHTQNDLFETCLQLVKLLGSAGFSLHKWHSNSREFLNIFQSYLNNESNKIYNISSENTSNKVLGLQWDSEKDIFSISLPNVNEKGCFTKREVLSKIASMFDPIGFLGCVVVVAKITMQKIWLSKLDWDEKLSVELNTEWNNFFQKIPCLQNITISRNLFLNLPVEKIEIHSFCDASLKAYGSCLYLRVLYANKVVSCRLICSKSRVAPLKTVSLPRLELCGAVMAAKLVDRIVKLFKNKIKISTINLWSDSEIVLCWLASHASRWSIFVSNRVALVQTLTENYVWRHVDSENNPADCLSRGILPDQINDCKAWWQGPSFLHNYDLNLNKLNFTLKEQSDALNEERKSKKQISLHVKTETFWSTLFSKFSCFSRLQRTVAYCLRFINNYLNLHSERTTGPLTVQELNNALNLILKKVQSQNFSSEIAALKAQKCIINKQILSLNPFIDDDGFLRVGGRLSNANITYEQKYPLLLPAKNIITILLLKREHLKLYHAGPQTVLSNFRLRYWPLDGLREIKRIINNCMTCYRFKAQPVQQILSSLPKDRVSINRPFHATGVDFGGPLQIKSSPLRNAKILKCYFAVFVCMATKAVHIELVSDLSTEAFLATLKRFISRRGNPAVIYSDNATNFLGSKNRIKELYDFFKISKNINEIQEFLSEKETQWKFIPPLSPHWGGIWEAAVKSIKYHLFRVIGDAHLTFETLYTCLTQIEAILNSRPMYPMSNNPSDLNVITPGHFLIGSNLTSFPEKDLISVPTNRLSQWQHCARIQQHFWKRWSIEYLNRLQNRPKWLKPSENLKPNDLVLLKEDHVPPLKWPRARILEVVPGNDGKVRMVKLITQKGTFIRNISKVCLLPNV